MLKIYKNKATTFKCKVTVESDGKSVKNVKSRLVLYPSNDNRNVMFEGVVQHNECIIDINPDININSNGKAILEIIVDDSSIFMPWNSLYEIISNKIKVESAEVVYNKKPLMESNRNDMDRLIEEAAKMIGTNRKRKSANSSLVRVYKESIKSLSKNQLKIMVEFIKKEYKPKKESIQWAKKVLGESKSMKSKMLMYANEVKNKINE